MESKFGSAERSPVETSVALPIDHVAYVAPVLDGLVDSFQKLGFITPPPAELRNGSGTTLGQISTHVYLGERYIELTAPDPEQPAEHLQPYLDRQAGVHIVALGTGNVKLARAGCMDAGLSTSPVVETIRRVEPGGATARFAWFAFDPALFPEALVSVVQHLTPELIRDQGQTFPGVSLESVDLTVSSTIHYRRLAAALLPAPGTAPLPVNLLPANDDSPHVSALTLAAPQSAYALLLSAAGIDTDAPDAFLVDWAGLRRTRLRILRIKP